jgi:hypothetical protein
LADPTPAKEMSWRMDDLELWNLRWSVETSARYHDWRRTSLSTVVRLVRLVTLTGAIVALVTAFSSYHLDTLWASIIVGAFSVLIAVVNLLDLVENFTGTAQRHETLYQRFKHLQAEIERYSAEPEKHLAEWRAEAQTIRIDEPPTLWAIYAKSWNQTIERYAVERKGYYRQISWWQSLLGHVRHFTPQDFPAAA